MTPKGLFKGAFRRAPQGLFKGAFRMAPQGLFEGSGAALRVQVRLVSNQFHLRSTDILAAKQVDEDEEKSEVDHVEMVVDFVKNWSFEGWSDGKSGVPEPRVFLFWK